MGISLYRYISVNFTKSFLTIFLPLFFIGSLVSTRSTLKYHKIYRGEFFWDRLSYLDITFQLCYFIRSLYLLWWLL